MLCTLCGTYGDEMFEGKIVERVPVRDLARRRRARMVLSLRVGMRKGELMSISVSVRMNCGDGGFNPGAGEACRGRISCRSERSASGSCMLALNVQSLYHWLLAGWHEDELGSTTCRCNRS